MFTDRSDLDTDTEVVTHRRSNKDSCNGCLGEFDTLGGSVHFVERNFRICREEGIDASLSSESSAEFDEEPECLIRVKVSFCSLEVLDCFIKCRSRRGYASIGRE
ncbi:hypothetical protein SAMN06266787_10869 [Halorubrum ezzemoulense]|uniref:Uncharacterized protein n=1 Tax=Halorubrum ezzemoulense TaxID=337243 RepID=A0A238Y650_HALEZ|nr:hypothetical protein SAMN06266787_10869 [Halorubrum ezzemoulense]